MAHRSASAQSKDASTFLQSYEQSLASQIKTVHKFDEKELELCGFIDQIPFKVHKFFWDIILKKGLSTNYTVDQLYCHFQKADPKIQHIIRSTKDLKDFFSFNSNVFNIDGDRISLKNAAALIDGHMKWIKALLQNDYPDINKTVLNAIQFYSDILFDKEDDFPIVNLVTHRNKAKQDVQIIATNPVELKSFLIAYPKIFNVNGDKVTLTYIAACDRSDYSWLQEMCGMKVKNHRLRLLGKAVTYYLLILFKQQSLHQLPLTTLFSLASNDVKELTATVADLKKLFVKYICVFQINKKNVTIKDSLLINLKQDEVRLRDIKGSELSISEVILMIEENLIKTALDVCIRTIKRTLDLKCSLEVPLKQLLPEFEYLFDNVNDLKMFLSYHPNDFFIKDNMVSLRKCEDTTSIHPPIKSNFSSLNKSMKPVDNSVLFEQVKDFCVNFLLQNVGANVQLPLAQFRRCISLAPPELHEILSNEKDLRFIINQFSNILNITDDYILLKKCYENPNINSTNSKIDETLMFFVWVLKEKVGVEIEFPIARLKIYVDLAPSEIKVKDIFQLKAFLQKYPDIFIIKYNNVILKRINDEKYSKYNRYEKLCYVESYSTAEAISFYAKVLSRFCSNLEVPVEHLFGYQTLAPVEVIALAKDHIELKKFLSTHPDIFSVQENNVCLKKYFNASESNVEAYDVQDASAIKFYSSILDRVSHNKEFPIVRLFGYQYLASPEVRDLIKTPLELKAFLNKYPNVFVTNNDVVFLKKLISRSEDLNLNEKLKQSVSSQKEIESTLSDLSLLAKSDKKNKAPVNIKTKNNSVVPVNAGFNSRKSSFIRAIRFYSNIMFKKGPNSEHLISNLLSFRTDATNEIKEVAKKPNELLTFLSKFPQIFTVNRNKCTVMLTDMISFYKNERNWIKELLPKYHQSTTNHEAVVSGIQFYVNIIFERGLEVLPIKSLFRYRKTAMADVQTLANSANELKDFLSMYPEIFKLSEEGVSLTEVAISHKIEPKWIEGVIGDTDIFDKCNRSGANEISERDLGVNNLSTDRNNDSAVKEVDSMIATNFFKSIFEKEGKSKNLTHSTLFEYLSIAPQEVRELFKTLSDLKEFFIKYSDIFTVKGDCVILESSKSESKNKKKKKQRLAQKSNSSNSSQLTDNDGSIQNNYENSASSHNITNLDNQPTKVSEDVNSCCNLSSTILFYSNIIFRKGPHLEHSIATIFSNSTKAPSIVKQTVKNIRELKAFLSNYPQLFSVNNEKNTVTLTDWQAFHKNQRSWIKELLPEHHQSTTNHEIIVSTIQFYSNILFEKNPKCKLHLSRLFSYRNSAIEDVQMLVQNLKDLNKFLSTFPNIFVVIKDKVSLTDFVISQLKQPKWVEQLVNSHKSSVKNIQTTELTNLGLNTAAINEELLKKKKIATRRTIQFYYKIMLSNVSNKGFPLSQLFDYLPEAPSDVQEVVKTITELNNFFSNYPHIFTVNNGMVSLTSFRDK